MRRSLTLLCLCACGDATSSDEPFETELGGFVVRVEHNPARLQISAEDGTVLIDGFVGDSVADGPPAAAAAFRSSAATYEMQYGAFKIEEPDPGPWHGVEKFVGARLEDGALLFDLVGAHGSLLATAAIESPTDSHLAVTLSGAAEWNRASMAFDCAPDEHFLGFGGQTAAVDHRGFTVPIWVQEDGLGKIDTDTYDDLFWFGKGRLHSTHTPMPMYVSSRGYAFVLDSPFRSLFAMCSEDPTVVRVESWEGELRAHIFYGPSPKQSIERMTEHVGRPVVPPAFAFAPWLDAIFGSANVRRVAQKLRDEDVPASVLWTEDWRGGADGVTGYALDEDWELDRGLYPDFETLAEEVRALGYKFLIYHNSFLDPPTRAYEEATEQRFAIEDENRETFHFPGYLLRDMSMLDLTNPEAVAWAKQQFRESLEFGTDGYMADFAEWLPVNAVLHEGTGESEHNLYPVRWQLLHRELFDEMFDEDGIERLFFVRSAFLGSQPLVSVVWVGDQQTDWGCDDGIASVIPMGVGLGVTGFPFFGHDIAGYQSLAIEPTSRELWFRWVTFGALSPVMRTHHGRFARDNWNWESSAESTAHLRRWAKLHMRLFPYLFALAEEAVTRGTPMLRAMALEHPEFQAGWVVEDQFMLGDRMYVAPVLEEGAEERSLVLPEGLYFPLEGGDGVASQGNTFTRSAALTEIIALVPAGALLVLMPEDIDTLVQAPGDASLVTIDDVGDDRELWVWPGGASSWTESGGLSYAWEGANLSGTIATATYNDGSVNMVTEGDDILLNLAGPGTLRLNDAEATLTVTGGVSDREIRVRVRGL